MKRYAYRDTLCVLIQVACSSYPRTLDPRDNKLYSACAPGARRTELIENRASFNRKNDSSKSGLCHQVSRVLAVLMRVGAVKLDMSCLQSGSTSIIDIQKS